VSGVWRRATTNTRMKVALRLARHGLGPGAGFESRLVWIFGSPRSGSTWLLQTLGDLPAVVPINEPLIGEYLGNIVCDYRGVNIADLDVSNFTFERQRRHVDSQFFSEHSRATWSPLLGKLIKTRFLAHAAEHAPSQPLSKMTVLVKEPNGSQAADLILDAVPRSRVLFLLRDGRDVVDSELAAMAPGGWLSQEFEGISPFDDRDRLDFVVRSASRWLWRTEVVEQVMRRQPRQNLTVKYEELLAAPLDGFRRIAGWLGLDVSDGELQRTVDEHSFERLPADWRGPEKFYRAAQPGLWREHLSDAEQAAVEDVIGAKLRQLGYAT
jgi:hypothetical protein